MNDKNIKNIKIGRINNNSVSTIGYTNEKIENLVSILICKN